MNRRSFLFIFQFLGCLNGCCPQKSYEAFFTGRSLSQTRQTRLTYPPVQMF